MKNNSMGENEAGVVRAAGNEVGKWDWAPTAEPWAEPVDGGALLDGIRSTVKRFVVLPPWAGEALALFSLHTYAFHLREVSTYLGIESPEMRCGKTTLLTVLSELVNRPVVAANISSPAFFRVIEETRPTLIIDEADTLLLGNDELRGILNAGYTRKTAFVVRVAHEMKKEMEPGNGEGRKENGESRLVRFSCWCPKAMASIGRLPRTLADRCIVIRMQRKTGREECKRLRDLEVETLRRKCARFVLDHQEEIARARPSIPPALNDREADIWEPLLALADLAGGAWPELAREAAVKLSANMQENNPLAALLLDIMVIFVQQREAGEAGPDGIGECEVPVEIGERDQNAEQGCLANRQAGGLTHSSGAGRKKEELWSGRLFSRTLVDALNLRGDRPWAEMQRGRQITELWLAQQLRPYGVRPRTMRIGECRAKGYMEADFKEVFQRYIPRADLEELVAEVGEPRSERDPDRR